MQAFEFLSNTFAAKVKKRKWFSPLCRFRGWTRGTKESEDDQLLELDLESILHDTRRELSLEYGLDSTWTTDLLLMRVGGRLKDPLQKHTNSSSSLTDRQVLFFVWGHEKSEFAPCEAPASSNCSMWFSVFVSGQVFEH